MKNSANAVGNGGDDGVEFGDGGIVERVAFRLPVKRDDEDGAALLGAESPR